jgi:hypothetical protein
MPLLNWDSVNLASSSLPGQFQPPPAAPEPDMGGNPILDTMAAALRQNNIVSNLGRLAPAPPPVAGYNAITAGDTAGYEDNLDRPVSGLSYGVSGATAVRSLRRAAGALRAASPPAP